MCLSVSMAQSQHRESIVLPFSEGYVALLLVVPNFFSFPPVFSISPTPHSPPFPPISPISPHFPPFPPIPPPPFPPTSPHFSIFPIFPSPCGLLCSWPVRLRLARMPGSRLMVNNEAEPTSGPATPGTFFWLLWTRAQHLFPHPPPPIMGTRMHLRSRFGQWMEKAWASITNDELRRAMQMAIFPQWNDVVQLFKMRRKVSKAFHFVAVGTRGEGAG